MAEIVRLEAVNKARWNGRVALRRFVTGVCTNTECPVCLSDFADGTPIWRLSCGHGGCASPSCLFNSLTNAQKEFECPLCRCEFPRADPPAPVAESDAPPPGEALPPPLTVHIGNRLGKVAFGGELDAARRFFSQWGCVVQRVHFEDKRGGDVVCVVQYSDLADFDFAQLYVAHGLWAGGVRLCHEKRSLFEMTESEYADLSVQVLTVLGSEEMAIPDLVGELRFAFNSTRRFDMECDDSMLGFLATINGVRLRIPPEVRVPVVYKEVPNDGLVRLWAGLGLIGNQAFQNFEDAISYFHKFGALVMFQYKQTRKSSFAFLAYRDVNISRRVLGMGHLVRNIALDIKLVTKKHSKNEIRPAPVPATLPGSSSGCGLGQELLSQRVSRVLDVPISVAEFAVSQAGLTNNSCFCDDECDFVVEKIAKFKESLLEKRF